MKEVSPLESPEKPPEYMKVFRVRHGETEYKEQTTPGGIAEDQTDLTENGKQQIEQAADKIAARLDKEKDIVFVASSPRRRTQDTASIIRNKLQELGFELWDDEKSRSQLIQQRIRNIDVFDADGNALVPTHPDYAGFFNGAVAHIAQEATKLGMSDVEYLAANPHPSLETLDSTAKRSRDHLTYLMRVAHAIQPKFTRRLVIIEAEHVESLDDFTGQVTSQARTEKNKTGMKKGEVVEIDIPVSGNELQVRFIDQEGPGNAYTVKYDATTRTFLNANTLEA